MVISSVPAFIFIIFLKVKVKMNNLMIIPEFLTSSAKSHPPCLRASERARARVSECACVRADACMCVCVGVSPCPFVIRASLLSVYKLLSISTEGDDRAVHHEETAGSPPPTPISRRFPPRAPSLSALYL